jgi:acyl phosphate:glycerol-3-phosphate acyltransferase
MTTALLVLAGYVAGSMPFGLWLPRLLRGDDVRRYGSGNIGGTNVWRAFGRRYGLPVVVLDTAKGFAPALAGVLLVDDLAGVLAGAAAMAGHWRPVFLRWQRGGKTVATAGGAFLAVAPLVGLASGGLWVVVFLVGRYASLASMVAAASLPVLAVLLGEPWPVIAFAAAAAVVVLVLHRANIRRLRAGTENRFEFSRKSMAGVG